MILNDLRGVQLKQSPQRATQMFVKSLEGKQHGKGWQESTIKKHNGEAELDDNPFSGKNSGEQLVEKASNKKKLFAKESLSMHSWDDLKQNWNKTLFKIIPTGNLPKWDDIMEQN
jgi:hypothetical protein